MFIVIDYYGCAMWEKPLPNIDIDNKPLFEGYKDHEFLLFRCQDCGEWYFPKSFCQEHENESFFGNIETEPASGEGEVFAFTVTHRPFHPGFEGDVPYTFALIKLQEGPMFGSQIIGIDTNEVEIGMPVEVSFKDIPEDEIAEGKREYMPLDDGFTLPYFTPSNEEVAE